MHSVLVSLTPSCLQLLSVTFCPVQDKNFLTDGPSKQFFTTTFTCNATKRKCKQCIFILNDMFPKWICLRISLILNNIHSQLIHNEEVGCYNAD